MRTVGECVCRPVAPPAHGAKLVGRHGAGRFRRGTVVYAPERSADRLVGRVGSAAGVAAARGEPWRYSLGVRPRPVREAESGAGGLVMTARIRSV